MGMQINSDNTNIYGLCNAVILSKPKSEFALKWYDSYKNFRSTGRDKFWDEHSVIKPLELSKIYPDLIKILDHSSFFYPLWYTIHDILFNNNYNIEEYKKIISNNYCIHLWDTYSHNYLKTIDENNIYNNNTLYNIFSRKFLNNKISILFLTYNRLDITQKCLNSYLKCLNRDDIEEIIILDNNSNNDVIQFLKEFQNKHYKIKIIFSNQNLGVCHGRIILMNEAKGDIIISLDSDAYLINNIFFDKIKDLLYDEKYGIVGISGAYIKSWEFGKQEDIPDDDKNEYIVDHIAGCCQAFRKDLFHFGFKLDPYYSKFWVEDTDLSIQSLNLNKINYRIPQHNYIEHHWGGSGKEFQDLFLPNWNYFSAKWKNLNILKI
jgi:GT2 family glycosyltransferase